MPESARDRRDAQAHNTAGNQALHQGDGTQNNFNGVNHNYFFGSSTVAPSTISAVSMPNLLGGYQNAAAPLMKINFIQCLSYDQVDYIDHEAYYRTLLGKRVPKTKPGVWGDQRFRAWRDTSPAKTASVPPCLWVQGTLGSGKTMLCAYVADQLRRSFDARNRRVCLQYYVQPRQDSEERNYTSSAQCIIKSLLIQILQSIPSESVTSSFQEEFDRFCLTKVPPDTKACWTLLKNEAMAFDMVYVVIDSLDQYRNEQARKEVCSMLCDLPSHMRVMVTSRSAPFHLPIGVNGCLRLKTSPDDIKIYVQSRMDADEFQMRKEIDEPLKEKIIEDVTRASNGLFLLLELNLDCLCIQGSVFAIKESLRHLAENVGAAFKASVDQINNPRLSPSMTDFDCALARHTLTWVTHALRPLTTAEIMESFAIQPNRPQEYSRKDVNWTSICAGLVDMDAETNVVRLVHEEVGQYLLKTVFFKQQNNHTMASQCLRYLLLGGLQGKPRPLMDYAANNWMIHFSRARQERRQSSDAKSSPSELEDLVLRLFCNPARVSACFEAMSTPDLEKQDIDGMTGLHATTYLNLPGLVKELVHFQSVNINAITKQRQTALHWAVRYNRTAMVKCLLEQEGIDRNLTDRRNNSPLHYAVVCSVGNRDDIVRMLVSKPGLDLHQRGEQGLSPLSTAIHHGPSSTAKILISYLDDVNERDYSGWSPLRNVMYYGKSTELFDFLLAKGPELNSPEAGGWTPLMHAVQQGNLRQAKSLLTRMTSPADANLKSQGKSPLQQALEPEGTSADMANLLIDCGANVNEKFHDDHDSTPLIKLTIKGDGRTAFNLLRKGMVDIDHQDKNGMTALHHAIKRRKGTFTWLLIEFGADLALRDTEGESPLDIAVVLDDVRIAWLLCHYGAEVNSVDSMGMTSLHKAAGKGHVESVRLLLSWGAKQDVRDKSGLMPAQHLAKNGPQRETISKLLQRMSLDGRS